MGMVNGVRLINNLVSGAMDSTALQTQLGTASNYGSFAQALSVRSQVNMAMGSATPAAAIGNSVLGKQLVEASPLAMAALQPVGSVGRPTMATSLYKAGLNGGTTRTFTSMTPTGFNSPSGPSNFNGLWVLLEANGVLRSSVDGAAWSASSAIFTGTPSLQGASLNNAFYFIGANPDLTSFQCIWRWTGVGTNPSLVLNTNASGQMTNVAFGNSIFVALRQNSTEAWSSPDGTTWTPRTGIASIPQSSVGFCIPAGVFTVQGASSNAATSANGTSWTSNTSGPGADGPSPQIVSSPSICVMARSDTNAFSSVRTTTNGINWTSRALPSNSIRGQLHYAQGMFFFTPAGSSNLFTYSLDGITWQETRLTTTNPNPQVSGYNPARGEIMYINTGSACTSALFV